ncbi:MAG: GGDEF domain-containing protein [Halobacteriovoraceae bacterium]|nr:GGDEF domain-containing protein [Halobacteriovoraceae bacterium]
MSWQKYPMDKSLDKIPTLASKLIDFFSNYGNCKEPGQLYGNVEKFLQDNFKISPLLVFSFPERSRGELSDFRYFWNKDSLKNHYNGDFIKRLMNDIRKIDIKKKKWISGKTSHGYYYAFYCGPMENQIQIGVFQSKRLLDDGYRLFDHLINFVENENTKINDWKNIQKQNSLIYVDDVSGLYNQRKLHLDLKDAIKRYKKYKQKFATLFIDIDHFKKINDSYGHVAGSRLLFQVGKVLKDSLRNGDLIYRYGGDEFVVIIENINVMNAKEIADRIVLDMSTTSFTSNKSELYKISVSIGIAVYPDNTTNSSEILDMADKMLFRAKSEGRGRVCMMEDLFEKN